MPMVSKEDTVSKGFLKPSDIPTGQPIKLRALGYKRTEGGRFPDQEGYSTEYEFEILDEKLKEMCARPDGSATMNCNSRRLRTSFFNENVEEGDVITLTKSGSGFDTKYEIAKVAS